MKEEGRKHQDPEPEGKLMEHARATGEGKRPDTLHWVFWMLIPFFFGVIRTARNQFALFNINK